MLFCNAYFHVTPTITDTHYIKFVRYNFKVLYQHTEMFHAELCVCPFICVRERVSVRVCYPLYKISHAWFQ